MKESKFVNNTKLKKVLTTLVVSASLAAVCIPIGVYAYNDVRQQDSIQQVSYKQDEYKQSIEDLVSGIDELDNAGCIQRIAALEEALNNLSENDWKLYNGGNSGYYNQNKSNLSNAIKHVKNHAYELYNSRIQENTVDTTDLSEDDCNSYKSNLDAIRSEIDEAKDTVFDSEDSYNELVTKIDDQKTVYDNAIEQIQTKEKERKAAEEAAAKNPSYNGQTVEYNSSKGSYGYYNNSGVWTPAYYNDYYGEAASDGSMTQWADGYYVAHSWSSNGRAIASRPGQVYINGRYYRYVSSRVVPVGQEYDDELEAWVHQNGGIAFQTCVSGGYLITHYEPVE